MPYFEEGVLHADPGGKEVLQETVRCEEGETITFRKVTDGTRSPVATQKLRRNDEFDSDWEHSLTDLPDEDTPLERLAVTYWLSDTLSTSVIFEQNIVEEDGDGYVEDTATIVYHPMDSEVLETCGVEYNSEGKVKGIGIELATSSPLTNFPDISPLSTLSVVAAPDGEYDGVELLTLRYTGDGPVFTCPIEGKGLMELPIDIVPGVSCEVKQKGKKYVVRIQIIDEETRDFSFPKTVFPDQLKAVLEQEKRLGGIHSPSENDMV